MGKPLFRRQAGGTLSTVQKVGGLMLDCSVVHAKVSLASSYKLLPMCSSVLMLGRKHLDAKMCFYECVCKWVNEIA